MLKDQLMESLKLAIKTEEDGRAMYIDASAKVTNPLAKSTFSQLAKEENTHIDLIKKFYNSISSGGEGVVSKEIETALNYNLLKKTIFEAAKSRMQATVASDPDVSKAYQAALKFEEDGAKMYEKSSAETDNPKAKKLYDFMNVQENEHYRLLAETLNYLDNPNQWFMEEEKPHFEG